MRKSLLALLGLLAVSVAGCADGGDNHDRVISTFAPSVTAKESWRERPGGATLSALLEEAGMTATPRVLTQAIEGVGTKGGTMLTATFDRPGELQAALVDEIRAMEIEGLSPAFLGLMGWRDGYLVEVFATTPDGAPGLTFTVLVPDT